MGPLNDSTSKTMKCYVVVQENKVDPCERFRNKSQDLLSEKQAETDSRCVVCSGRILLPGKVSIGGWGGGEEGALLFMVQPFVLFEFLPYACITWRKKTKHKSPHPSHSLKTRVAALIHLLAALNSGPSCHSPTRPSSSPKF